MVQTLITIAALTVLCGAILTSALASVKSAAHRALAARTQTAMTDATSEFVFWAQRFVSAHGTEANWNAQPMPVLIRPLCAGGVNCAYDATMTWKVTGTTAGVKPANAAGQTLSTARNLAPAVDEQRISATIDVAISDATGRQVYGGRTEQVTARIFDAQPYIAITGVRDLSSDVGVVRDREGDSGGTLDVAPGARPATPNPAAPDAVKDTVIRTTIDCVNSPGFDEANPQARADAGSQLDRSYRTGGSQAWAYELPCTPAYGVPPPPPSIAHYTPPNGSVYEIDASTANTAWKKGDDWTSSFPR